MPVGIFREGGVRLTERDLVRGVAEYVWTPDLYSKTFEKFNENVQFCDNFDRKFAIFPNFSRKVRPKFLKN